MFIHWGLYSLLGRHEWAMNWEQIPRAEYERLASLWKPKRHAARQWARLARKAGMRYMVMTTKHHEGFLLWDSRMTDYNAAQRGPGRDLVAEFVEAARAEGLRVGFYYSLMDWHHPDGSRCLRDTAARKRFLEFTQGCVRELCSNYGKIDIFWYDVAWPLPTAEAWDSWTMNNMVRQLQPEILINNRSKLPEDFGTPEEHITPETAGRPWEACMTFNGSWGWQDAPAEDWRSAREIIGMLRSCCAGGGNLLLNIGPKPDGSVPEIAVKRLLTVGRWLERYGGIVYGKVDRLDARLLWRPGEAGRKRLPHQTPRVYRTGTGYWTRRGTTLYFWCFRWTGSELAIGGLTQPVRTVRLYPDGKALPFRQEGRHLLISGLPERCPDRIAGVVPIELTFKTMPEQCLSAGYDIV